MKTVLVIGSGGREHALAWKLSLSPQVTRVIVAPGNAGMPAEWERWFVSFKDGKKDFQLLAERALAENVSLVVVGPDDPLAQGIVDVLEEAGLRVMGPRANAAQIEASKAFGKDVMNAAGVPTARHWVLESPDEAVRMLKSLPWSSGWVLKADGLALGKGVRIVMSLGEGIQAARDLFPISGKVILEERLEGEELSWMAFCDGSRCALLEPARDYKRLRNRNEGPNTGGMGAFSPIPRIPASMSERVRARVFEPVLNEMKKRGCPFKGVLFAGLMLNPKTEQFWVLEFNARFGDPETQVLLPRMQGDLYEWCQGVARGNLGALPESVPFAQDHAVYVVAASSGYPEAPEVGKEIESHIRNQQQFFFAGVRMQDNRLVTSGGRVLGSLGVGATHASAREVAYTQLREIKFEGMHFRTDIGE